MKPLACIGFAIALCTWSLAGFADEAVQDIPFIQEYHETFPIAPGGPADDVRSITVDGRNVVWAATKAGVYSLRSGKWRRQADITKGPTYDVVADEADDIWVGAWDGLYRIRAGKAVKIDAVDGPVSAICITRDVAVALGPDGNWRRRGAEWEPFDGGWSRGVRSVIADERNRLWVGTGVGLYCLGDSGPRYFRREDELVSGKQTSAAFAPDGRLWLGSRGGIDVYENDTRVRHFTVENGLPNFHVRSLTFAPDGVLWAGTALGVARYDGESWSLRFSKRWLLSDDVRDVAFDSKGNAWIATAAGVSAIKRKTMTLAEKADYYHAVCRRRHVRAPGLVEKCRFPNPADRTKWVPRDDDNDGEYTSMYLAMESFRYAATKDPEAKRLADETYDALEFLQTVTGTDGFVARTVIPSTWTRMGDPNETISPEEAVERRVRDPRYKPVEVRWRPSADGKWLWKGDTSSDEITGHFYGYATYYRHAADEEHKARVRRHVRKIMDYIIDGGFVLRDIDGEPTRWGVWSPEKLLHDPDWRVERPINCFELLSYLKTTCWITGDEKYQKIYNELIEKHGYAEIARRPKAYEPSERTYIDDELMMLAIPGLLLNEADPELHATYMEGITWSYRTVDNDHNPFFNFTFASVGGRNFHLDESIQFLRDTPLDLILWRVDSANREDIALRRFPIPEPLQTTVMRPPSERGVMRWDKNPWEAVSGDFSDEKGSLESDGVFWMLPYWMGRCYGYIQGAE